RSPLSRALCPCSGAARAGTAGDAAPGSRRRAGGLDGRRHRRCDTAFRRSAETPQPARQRRCLSPAPGGAAMTFLWPDALWLFALVPLCVAAYLWVLRRKKKAALKYASLAMVRDAMGPGQRFRRHIPPVLFLIGLVTMIVAVARPAAIVMLPSEHDTIILSMDVSGSMRATDIEPNRLAAAQSAARAFVAEQPRHTRIGVVSFAATASVVQPPTESRDD